jgi:deazaflavin-dependent oxidoreductase (nitroreductase family)
MWPNDEAAGSAPAQTPPRAFPIQGSNLYRILSEPEFKQAFHAKLKKYNPIIVALYRIGLLPLFGAARSIMILTTKGRKSGKSRQNPVGYFRIGGVLHLFSAWGKRSNWYKNLTANPDHVTIQIGRQKLPVHAQVLDDPAEIQNTLEKFVTESPEQARNLFGWDSAQDRIETADFSAIIHKVLIVRFIEKQG